MKWHPQWRPRWGRVSSLAGFGLPPSAQTGLRKAPLLPFRRASPWKQYESSNLRALRELRSPLMSGRRELNGSGGVPPPSAKGARRAATLRVATGPGRPRYFLPSLYLGKIVLFVQTSHSVTQRPHSVTQRPHSLTQRPHSLTKRPHSLTQRPHSVTQRPHSLT